MTNLNYLFLEKQYEKLGTNAYVANNLLNIINRIKKYYSDTELDTIHQSISENILLENWDRSPNLRSIKIVNNHIYELDEWILKNEDKLGCLLDKL
ncbi:hypothetical protein [Myroides odoratimimus]|uniref:hypothetical protein n=1 Tax=Myroides odoratimimus TaxID=76832 RepID=UPI00046AEFE4|nr:hypothetical protein [Myroides odoratimimus]